MSSYILAQKILQTQMYDDKGHRTPVTHLKARGNYIVDIKTKKTDGYDSLKIGFSLKKNIPKPVKGELKKKGIEEPLSHIKEFRTDRYITDQSYTEKKYTVGQAIVPADLFQDGDRVDVTGSSKGKGFQGVMRRHGFGGGPRTHGQSDRARAPGSVGSGTTPGRVYKGKRLAGQMGGKRITIKGLRVLRVEDDTIMVKGLIPGPKQNVVAIKKTEHFH